MSLHPRTLLFFGALLAIIASLLLASFTPSALALVGFSSGFTAPFEHVFHLLLYAAMGVWAVMLGKRAPIILPMVVLQMFVIAMCLSAMDGGILRSVIIIAMLGVFVYTLTQIRSGMMAITVVICAATSFHHGLGYAEQLSVIPSAPFFVLGSIIAMSSIMAIAICVGVLSIGQSLPLYERMRSSTSFGSFL